MIRRLQLAALGVALMVALWGGMTFARGFGGGGARGGGGGGYRGGGGGGFAGGGGGYRGGGGGGFAGGAGGGRGGVSGGSYGGGGGGGGYGGMSHMSSSTPSRSAPARPQAGYGSFSGKNPYSEGGGSGHVGAGSGSGSYTTERGGTTNYGGAGVGGRGEGGGAAGRGVYGISGTTAGGRDYATAGRAGGAVGPGGNAVGGRSSVGAVSGPNGTAVGGSRSGVAVGPGGVVAGGSRGGVAVGAGGAVAGRGYGVAGYRPYGDNVFGAYHQGWVHGCWNAHGSAAAWGWGVGVGLGWGLASWGYGSSLYGMGYTPYTNPYYSAPMIATAGYDYSQPIDTTGSPPEDAVAAPAVSSFDAARDSFKQGTYDRALQQAGDGLAKTPNDSDLHEFRALCLFALKRYDDSAAALYGVLSVGPGWDWTTLIGLYPDVETYTGQLRSLEGYCAANPGSAAARFVLAYQYLTEGHADAAAGILRQVVALKPDDTLSAKLLRGLDPPKDAPAATPAETAATPVAADSPPPAGAEIAGTWNAQPAAGTSIALAIGPGGDFTWKVTQGGRSQQFAGASTYGSGLLTLARTEGPALVGRVSWKDPAHMTFRIMGGGPDDPGLGFSK